MDFNHRILFYIINETTGDGERQCGDYLEIFLRNLINSKHKTLSKLQACPYTCSRPTACLSSIPSTPMTVRTEAGNFNLS